MTSPGGDTLAALRAESAANEAEALAELITGLEAVLPALEHQNPPGSERSWHIDEATRQVAEHVERLRVALAVAGAGAAAPPRNPDVESALDALLALQMPGGGFGASASAEWERASVIATAEVACAALAAVAHHPVGADETSAGARRLRAVDLAMAWLFAAWSEEGFGDHPGAAPRAASTRAALAALHDYASFRRAAVRRDEP